MADEEKDGEGGKQCPNCDGRGKYYDKSRHLVMVKCQECNGTGKVSS